MEQGVAKRIRRYRKDQVEFTKHAKIRALQRGISENFVKQIIFDVKKLVHEEYQKGTNSYKRVYRLSRRYDLVIVLAFEERVIKVITVYKTSKRVQNVVERSKKYHVIYKFERRKM